MRYHQLAAVRNGCHGRKLLNRCDQHFAVPVCDRRVLRSIVRCGIDDPADFARQVDACRIIKTKGIYKIKQPVRTEHFIAKLNEGHVT
ncbi:hypothetical protein D3C76_1705350 [compost metagenome]